MINLICHSQHRNLFWPRCINISPSSAAAIAELKLMQYVYESCESLLNGYITPSLCWCFMLFVAFAVTTNIQPHWCTCTVCAFSWSASKSLTWHYREQLFNVLHANGGVSQFCTIRTSLITSIICKLMSLWLLTQWHYFSSLVVSFYSLQKQQTIVIRSSGTPQVVM